MFIAPNQATAQYMGCPLRRLRYRGNGSVTQTRETRRPSPRSRGRREDSARQSRSTRKARYAAF